MSTLRANTLSNQAGSLSIPVDRVAQATAAAWVNFNGPGTVAIRRSFNVSSITDHGPGEFTINFTAAMPDTNYGFAFGAGFPGTRRNVVSVSQVAGAVAAGSLRIDVLQAATNTLDDPTQISAVIFS